MNGVKATIAVCLLVLSACKEEVTTGRKDITTDRKNFIESDDRQVLVVTGSWRLTSQNPSLEVPAVNSVRIECDRASRTCNEYIAKFAQHSDDPLVDVQHPYLWLGKEQYEVKEWTSSTLTARAQPRAGDIDLRLSLVDKSAERLSRETGARGAQGANPSAVSHWTLK